jgi:trk system potassium uptake protein TrkA
VFSLAEPTHSAPTLVVGLGRFGSALALTLVERGQEVLAVDIDERLVQHHADRLTHVVQVDATDEDAMRQIGAAEFQRAVVGIGNGIEASVLCTAVLVDLGIPVIWAKAITPEHGRILERIGAEHVVYPEGDMGRKVAHLVTGRLADYIEFDDGFAIAKVPAPAAVCGVPLGESGVRRTYGITVVGVKAPGRAFSYADRETVVEPGSVLAIAGPVAAIDRFAVTG